MVASTTPLHRAESRIPMRMFVKLSNPENGEFELTSTVDISCHGARVVSRNFRETDQRVLIRSIRGNLYSHARVVHCRSLTKDSYAVGLELFHPTGDWTTPVKPRAGS
jgi:hypothetical protein